MAIKSLRVVDGMLKKFEYHAPPIRLRLPEDIQLCRPVAQRTIWTYESDDQTIYDAFTGGPYSEYVIWTDQLPPVVGRRLDMPWWNFDRWPPPFYEISGGESVSIHMRGRYTFTVEVGSTAVLEVRGTSLLNQVSVNRADRQIGVFPATDRGFSLDLEGLDELELQSLLVVIGSRLFRRARRWSKLWLPKAGSPPQPQQAGH